MGNEKIEKIYPNLGVITETEGPAYGSFEHSSPWKSAMTAFYWTNFEYPLYHKHTDWEITIVLKDCIVQKVNDTEKMMTVGSASLIGPRDAHAFFYPDRVKNQYQGLTLICRDKYMRDLLSMYSPTLYDDIMRDPQPLYFNLSRNSLEKYTDMLLSIQTYENENTPETELQCNMVFSGVILKFLEQYQSGSDMPTVLKPFIQKLNNPMITQEQIKAEQEKLPYSYPQLTRIFKKYTRCTITQYVNRAKLQYAKELLSMTDMSISEITNELNFESPSYFHNLFKKHFNETPSKYRNRSETQ